MLSSFPLFLVPSVIHSRVHVTETTEAARPLAELEPQHGFFVGIDSDGCAFDTTEIKHKECFTPNIVKHWGLQAVSKYAREAAEFVNLYSKWRGINRWPALVMVFDLLRERPEVLARGVEPPQAPRIRAFIAADAYPKSNDGLAAYMQKQPDPELDRAWAWTTACRPFPTCGRVCNSWPTRRT